jgi:transposase-like protein
LTAFCFSAAMVAAITTDTQLRSTRDIHDQIKDIYGVEISTEMVSKITDHVVPEIKEWQNRPLERFIHLFLWMPCTTKFVITDK